MDMYDKLFSSGSMLNEQIAHQIFDILPENGPIMVIMNKAGNCWASDCDKFSRLNISESLLKELCGKIDDGAEPVVTQLENFSIIGTQLATEQTDCGYVIVVVPRCSSESVLTNIDLIETLLNQTGLIARLIEKNNLLSELQMKHLNLYGENITVSN